ncbi:MAG: cob(I)yrinic acid a,c-diamide adenosyltransferase [Candidatus Hodarchaeales archaeon]|jgi:cob(I)alamin adenosyltransferase
MISRNKRAGIIVSQDSLVASDLGLIHVISGNGKGKTTSSLGLALRAAGHGFRTLIIQLMKKGWNYGELTALQDIPQITIEQFGTPEFVDKKSPKEIDYKEAEAAVTRFKHAMFNETWDILILDEINVAIDFGLVSEDEIIDLLKRKPKKLEIILTGRYATDNIISLADYYSKRC